MDQVLASAVALTAMVWGAVRLWFWFRKLVG